MKTNHSKIGWLTWAALLVSIAVILLWAATNHRTWLISWHGKSKYYAIRADAGRFCFESLSGADQATALQGMWEISFADGTHDTLGLIPEDRTLTNGYGFRQWDWTLSIKGVSGPHVVQFSRRTVPFWPILALSLVPLVWKGVQVYRSHSPRNRLAKGLCPRCGYDLRASPENCPECGWRADERPSK